MLTRDPRAHKIAYLKSIAEQNRESAICEKCNAIRPAKKSGQGRIHHCAWCDTCTVGHDHHCVWCSKCIAGGNLYTFYVFVTSTGVCLMMFWMNAVLLVMKTADHYVSARK